MPYSVTMKGCLPVPENLNVTGRGLSPRQGSPPSPEDTAMLSLANSSRTSLSDGETEENEDYTLLDGVRDMNHMLVRQIETLRLKIKIDEKNYDTDKSRLVQAKESELQEKEGEIEELRESVTARDEAIQNLTRAAQEKDRTIQEKCAQIEGLHDIVKKTNEYAKRIQQQMTTAKRQRQKLESDPLYKQQNEEISKLTAELENLREKIQTMEGELSRALTIIEQQDVKLATMDAERTSLHEKFREDLDRASRAMRQEVERMREVMRQNYDEMRVLREQNKEMHGDVRAIKEMLKSTSHSFQAPEGSPGQPRPLSASPAPAPSYGRRFNNQQVGPGRMVGGNIATGAGSRGGVSRGGNVGSNHDHSSDRGVAAASRSGYNTDNGYYSNVSTARGPPAVGSSGYYSNITTSRLSTDVTTGRQSRLSQAPNKMPLQTSGQQNKQNADRTLPAICSVKDVVYPTARQPSGRGRPQVRKGSAVAKK